MLSLIVGGSWDLLCLSTVDSGVEEREGRGVEEREGEGVAMVGAEMGGPNRSRAVCALPAAIRALFVRSAPGDDVLFTLHTCRPTVCGQ